MVKNYRNEKQFLWILIFALWTVFSFSQNATFKKGVRQGSVKVKFTELNINTLKSITSTRGKKPLTGIQAFDKVSEKVGAKKMQRLFPENPNPRLEAKLKKHKLDLWYVVEIDPNQDLQNVVKQYKAISGLQAVEVEKEKVLSSYSFKTVPVTKGTKNTSYFNDPKLGEQWHYENTGQTGFANGSDINLFKAWDIVKGSPEVIVSIHDQGIDVKHPDLVDNIWNNKAEINGTTGVDDDKNGFVDDFHGWNFDKKNGAIDPEPHGTHVAGTVAAVNNNGIGVAGVAGGSGKNDGSKVMSVQCLGGGSIDQTYVYAANNGAVISQNSWGYTSANVTEQSTEDAINYFIAEAGDYPNSPMKGGIVIFAAGNSNSESKWYPGYYENTLSVSSIGPDWKKASYSNFGTWVDIAAPGGETKFGAKNGVLSTLPKNQYGFFQGTSMACPHVSGIAALALANRTMQLTPDALRKKLSTGVVDIDSHNPEYKGKLGSGHIDAFLAIQNNTYKAPDAISDFKLNGIAQEFANLSWTVPNDADDAQPVAFKIYYHTSPLNRSNLAAASSVLVKNSALKGETINYTLSNLLGLTNYYFAVVSIDRWDNLSEISNNVMGTTNQGPKIDVDNKSITILANPNNSFKGSHDLSILNNAEGVLRWEFFARHKNTAISYNAFNNINYPKPTATKIASLGVIGKLAVTKPTTIAKLAATTFKTIEKKHSDYPTNIIGDSDIKLSNSSATKFLVTEEDGFNLTHVEAYLRADPDLGPVIIEIYSGAELAKKSLIAVKEFLPWNANQGSASIKLDEQLYFNKGDQFWVVVHIPAGNKYPLGIGFENTPSGSENCKISFDLGKTWGPLEVALDSKKFAFNTTAISQNKDLGTYLVLDPSKGEINGNSTQATLLSADGSTLINGTYTANAILKSNDATKIELKIPVTLQVEGHLPVLKSQESLEFSSVFSGKTKEMELTVQNIGLGNFNGITLSISNPNFEIVGSKPGQIPAGKDMVLKIKYKPSAIGNDNGILKLTSSKSAETLNIILFGVSTEPAKISVTPMSQVIDNVAIGDQVTASITVENKGKAALKYFIPKYDTTGISDSWKGSNHKYGYKQRTSKASGPSALAYEFEDITTTGTDITDHFRSGSDKYYTLDMGFDFPYFDKKMEKIYISHQGFTTFDNSENPVNMPSLGDPFGPKGYISPLGTYATLSLGGQIHYKVETDRIIVQYTNITDGWSGTLTAQMVLFADGNIRFYYDNIDYSADSIGYLNILIEDYDKEDGILVHEFFNRSDIYSGLALGFDYPGPDIITSISNAGGILMPGESKQMEVVMETAKLNKGLNNRYINIISSDPAESQTIPLIQINVTSGGSGKLAISDTEIHFGDAFKGATKRKKITLKNSGNAPLTLTSFTLDHNAFQINGETKTTITPGLTKTFEVIMPTDVVADLTDNLHIMDDQGGNTIVPISGKVLDPPGIEVTNLDPIITVLNYKETQKHPIVIENNGIADLEVVATGNQWLTMSAAATTTATPNFTYAYDIYNDGSNYQWIDIRKKGTQVPEVDDIFELDNFWEKIKLPWAINYYGKDYNEMHVGINGILTFDEPTEIPFFDRSLPTDLVKTLIAPYWSFAAYNYVNYKKEDVGVFYYTDEDKFIVSWEYLSNFFGGLGDPISAQVIFYKNGTMKFQYKLNGNSDLTSYTTVIGLQNGDHTDVVKMPDGENVVHGNGLVYVISPAKKQVIAPGSKLNAQIELDARNVYAGQYEGSLKLHTNVPTKELLEKPISLTVNGTATIASNIAEVNFGEIMLTAEASSTKEFEIKNIGSQNLQLTNIKTESGATHYTIETYVYLKSWNGGFWTWVNIDDLGGDFSTILPNESSLFRINFTPSTAGDLTDKIIVGSDATVAEFILPITAVVTHPPALTLQTKEANSVLKQLTDKDTQFALFDNRLGKGKLKYEVSLDYLRKAIPSVTKATESITKTSEKVVSEVGLQSIPAPKVGISTYNATSFNRVLSHENRTNADNFLGYGGAKAFTSATRFNAGKEGFNLSHFQAYIEGSKKPIGTIAYEIRAGGSSVTEAITIAEGTVDYEFKGNKTGEWLTLPIKEAKGLYPNEEFYIIITYPYEIPFVQGVLKGIENTPGRYMFESDGNWLDLQDEKIYPGYGWLVRVAEEKFVSNAWVVLNGTTSGSTAPNAETKIQLDFTAANGVRGDQHAILSIRTNDPKNSVGKIPVKMHINEAPAFVNVPEKTVVANENSVSNLTLNVKDPENNPFTVASKEAPSWITYKIVDKKVEVTLAPSYENAGTYEVNFTTTDDLGAASSMKFKVEVMNTNRAPIVIQSDALTYSKLNYFDTRQFASYFSDLDKDAMTFTATIANSAVASITTSQALGTFVTNTHTAGETTLLLKATDTFGATKEQLIKVVVVNNRAPITLEAKSIVFTKISETESFDFAQYFSDADGDKLTFKASLAKPSIASLVSTEKGFNLESLANGETQMIITATDIYGASVEQLITVIVNQTEVMELNIFPNPVVKNINIKWENRWAGDVTVEIIAINGATVRKYEVKEVQFTKYSEFDLSNLTSGVYFIRVSGKEGTSSVVKFIKRATE
jgi:subtilisin family serine protease